MGKLKNNPHLHISAGPLLQQPLLLDWHSSLLSRSAWRNARDFMDPLNFTPSFWVLVAHFLPFHLRLLLLTADDLGEICGNLSPLWRYYHLLCKNWRLFLPTLFDNHLPFCKDCACHFENGTKIVTISRAPSHKPESLWVFLEAQRHVMDYPTDSDNATLLFETTARSWTNLAMKMGYRQQYKRELLSHWDGQNAWWQLGSPSPLHSVRHRS